MNTRLIFVALPLVLAASARCATHAEIRAEQLRQADGVHRKISRPEPTYGCRELFTAMLAYAEANTNLTRIADILALAEAMQDTDPASKGYGNFPWYSRDTEVTDFNAVDFCMQHAALLWMFHREKLPPPVRERFLAVLAHGLRGLLNHRPRPTYTNIAILNASDLILLGGALGDADAAAEGERRLTAFIRAIYDDGVHEFVSPTYYAVNVECLMLLEGACPVPRIRDTADALLRYLWTDIALNYYAPSQRLGGAHSRTYDYVFGFGGLDHLLVDAGWLAPPKGYRPGGGGFAPLYSAWTPPENLRALNAAYPRLVEQTWGGEPPCARTLYALADIAISTAWRKYHGRMDIPLAVDFPAPSRDARQPRVSFIPDGRGDPYGTIKISDGKTHSKAFHMDHYWASAQDKGDVLALALYREQDFADTTGTLESHLLIPRAIGAVWVNDTPLDISATNAIPPGAAVFLRHGTAALGIRIPWSSGGALRLIAETNAMNVMRLTFTHPPPETNPDNPINPVNPVKKTAPPPGIAYRLSAGGGLATDAQFSAFRTAFMAETIEAEATGDGITLRGGGGRLAVRAGAPYDTPPVTTPPPPRLTLACDGVDMGAPILAALPVISERIARHGGATPIPVAGGAPTVWEAVNARLSCVLEIGDAPAAPGGAYLWEPPGIPDPRAPGSGRAVYTLDIAKGGVYTLAAHVLTPTPENDSFFIRVTGGTGEDILPEEAWHLGVRQAWGWTELKPPLRLPEGRVTITLRTRETGAKVTQLRLTPQKTQL